MMSFEVSMTIERLNQIVGSMDMKIIHDCLQNEGYRHASKGGRFEFDICEIADANEVESTKKYVDVFDDKIYVGEIYKDVSIYPNTKFVTVTVKQIHRYLNNLEFPLEIALFTNAPINEEYEKQMAQIETCKLCKKQFAMIDLCEINGKLVCDDCFLQDLERVKSGKKSKLATKVKTKG